MKNYTEVLIVTQSKRSLLGYLFRSKTNSFDGGLKTAMQIFHRLFTINCSEMRITMNKDVIITMEGIQHDVDETEALIETVKGQYFKKNDSIYLLYQLPNKEATLKGRIKIKGETVEVIQGNSRLFFEVGKETTSFYPSPMGEILMELDTNVLKIEEEEDSLLVEFKYHLKMNGMYISRCTMKIVVVSDIEKET